MRRLPPLPTLPAFEAVARLGSVRAAAEALCVTPSAISHQLARLEESLGRPLFDRRNRRMVLTEAGRAYLNRIGAVLDRLEEASQDMVGHPSREVLTVALPPSFLALWLLPRLMDFRQHHPDLDLKLIDRVAVEDLRDMPDCAIEYRVGPPEDRPSDLLFEDEIVPLAAPALVARLGLVIPSDLRRATLIQTEQRAASWRTQLGNPPWLRDCPVLSVAFSHQAFDAARHGLGVALGNRRNAGFLIRDGGLCVPFPLPVADPMGMARYYFTCLDWTRMPPKVRAFRAWLETALARDPL